MYESIARRGYVDQVKFQFQAMDSRDNHEPPRVIQLTAGPGAGKSTILDQIAEMSSTDLRTAPIFVDIDSREKHTLLAVLRSIAAQVTALGEAMPAFQHQLADYEAAPGEIKAQHYQDLLERFHSEWEMITDRAPRIVMLDSCEKAPSPVEPLESPLGMIELCGGRTLFVLASQQYLRLSYRVIQEEVLVAALSIDEVTALDGLMSKASPGAVGRPRPDRLQMLCSSTRGRPLPVRMALAAHYEDWLNLNSLSDFAFADIGRESMLAIDNASESLRTVCLALTIVVHQVTVEILAEVTELSVGDVVTALELGKRVGIIREVENRYYRLHEEAVALVRRVMRLTGRHLAATLTRVVAAYRRRAEGNAGHWLAWSEAKAEEIFYTSYLDRREAGTSVANLVTEALSANDGEAARRIVRIAVREPSGGDLGTRVALANVANREFRPAEALSVLGEKSPEDEQDRLALGVAWHIARADALTNPCTLVRVDVQDAIRELDAATSKYRQLGDEAGVVRTLTKRGYVHMTIGEHDKAEEALAESIVTARVLDDPELLATGLDFLGELYRLIQDLERAAPPLHESAGIRQGRGRELTSGYTHFTLGNLARDQADYTEATRNYETAEHIFRHTHDFFRLHECLNDRSWLAFLNGDNATAKDLLEQEFELIARYSFGNGRSLYHHGLYHLAAEESDWGTADRCLDQGLTAVRQFPHTYMLVDLLHHDAQRAYRTGDFARVDRCLEELKAIEDKGCMVRVFRGRTMLIRGDIAFADGDRDAALRWWMEGLLIVALHGDSRTNVELFDDMVAVRVDRLSALVAEKRTKASWRRRWDEAKDTKGYVHLWGKANGVLR